MDQLRLLSLGELTAYCAAGNTSYVIGDWEQTNAEGLARIRRFVRLI